MLSTADIADMRATLARSLPDTATISRVTETDDGAGGQSVSWANVATDVACRLSPGSYAAGERQIAGKLAQISSWTITFPAGTDVQEKDRVIVGGTTYEVVGIGKRAAWEISRRVTCVQVA